MTSTTVKTARGTLLYDVSWETYEGILKAFGDRRFPHTYQEGTLEILMSPSEDHEQIAEFIGRMIGFISVELDIPIDSVRSATRRKKSLEHGLEPDNSYYVHPNRRKPNGNGGKESVPDLAIEIDLRRKVLKRLVSYARLGVREIWRYHKGQVEFFALGDDGEHHPVDRSLVFPSMTPETVTRFVTMMRESSEYEAIKGFLRWLRKHRPKS
jgi:Uma2 family endonuclease